MSSYSNRRANWRLGEMVRAGTVVLLLGACAGVSAADKVRVPGTQTMLEPPAGFTPSERFPGFERADLQSSVVITEVPAPVGELSKAMTKEALASQGMTLLSSRTQTVDGRERLLLHVAQQAAGVDFLKWMLLSGDQNKSSMVVGTYPKSAESKVGGAVKAAVLSAVPAAAGGGDVFEGLRFRVTATPTLKISTRMGNMLLLTETGNRPPVGPNEALYVVGSSLGSTAMGGLKDFSQARASQTAALKDVRNFKGRDMKLDGLPAYELTADGNDVRSGAAMKLYQVIAADGDGYFIAQGLVATARAKQSIAEFQRVTNSFKRTP
jgi:hypothetical protein